MNKNMVKNIAKRTGMNIVDETVSGVKITAMAAPLAVGITAASNKITDGKWNVKGAVKEVAKRAAILLAVRTTAAAIGGLVVSTADEIKNSKNSDPIDEIFGEIDEMEALEKEIF